MAKPSVYIETTIISYLSAWPSRDVVRLAQQQLAVQWWRDWPEFHLFTSQPMTDDPIIEEIQRVRESVSAKFNHDLRSIADDARQRQSGSGRVTVSLPPRRPPPPAPNDAPT